MRALRLASHGGALACIVLGGCGLNQEGVAPLRDRISFPASIKIDNSDPAEKGRWLYVVNSNADLRYNSGTVVAVNLDDAADDRDKLDDPEDPDNPDPHKRAWKLCPSADYVPTAKDYMGTGVEGKRFCCWDYLDHNILDCDERAYVSEPSTVAIGSFGAGIELQALSDAEACAPAHVATTRHDCNLACDVEPTRGRLYIGVRGNSSLTFIDVTRDAGNLPVLTCPESLLEDGTKGCAVKAMLPGNASQPTVLPDEPYTLRLDQAHDLLYVGHLRGDVAHASTGGISLFDVARAAKGANNPPTFLKPSGPFFPPDANGNFGVTSLTMRGDWLYATSRYLPTAVRVVTSINAPMCAGLEDRSTIELVGTSDTYPSPLAGAEIRGIQFLPARNAPGEPPMSARAFILQRIPPALVGFDVAMGENDGIFGNFASDVMETCQAPTFLQKDRTEEEEAMGDRDAHLYVTCFESGQVYVFDPRVPRLEAVIDVGRGPAGLEFAKPKENPKTKKIERLAYLVGFGSNNVSVIDLTPGNDTQYHVIQRIGFPSVVPRP